MLSVHMIYCSFSYAQKSKQTTDTYMIDQVARRWDRKFITVSYDESWWELAMRASYTMPNANQSDSCDDAHPAVQQGN